MGKSITIKGEKELYAKLTKLPDMLAAAERRAIRSETDAIADDLRAGAPVDTGKLRDSVQEELLNRGLTGRAVITAPHAQVVIYGTSTRAADDFVTPAENAARRRFPRRLRDEVQAEIRKL